MESYDKETTFGKLAVGERFRTHAVWGGRGGLELFEKVDEKRAKKPGKTRVRYSFWPTQKVWREED